MMETLEELKDLETYTFEASLVIPELILFASLLLRAPTAFMLRGESRAEDKLEHFWRVSMPFLENAYAANNARPRSHSIHNYIDDLLPDVCGTCFRFFSFTHGGNHRSSCSACYNDLSLDHSLAWERESQLRRITWGTANVQSLLAQLIYKYYSPNGDRNYTLKIPPIMDWYHYG